MMEPTPTPAPDAPTLSDFVVQDAPYQRTILFALPRTGKHVYAGTVPAATIAKRRAARKARRTTRQAQRRAA